MESESRLSDATDGCPIGVRGGPLTASLTDSLRLVQPARGAAASSSRISRGRRMAKLTDCSAEGGELRGGLVGGAEGLGLGADHGLVGAGDHGLDDLLRGHVLDGDRLAG